MRRMFAAKLAMGIVLALLSLGVLGGLLYLGLLQATEPLETLTVPVTVVGPGGDLIYDGTVDVANATAYTALRAAAADGNFTVTTRDYGDRVFVEEIAGHRNDGANGWVYAVEPEGGDPCYPSRAADQYPLQEGQRLLWRWSEDPVAVGPC